MMPPPDGLRVLVTAAVPDESIAAMRSLVGAGGVVERLKRDDPRFDQALGQAHVVFGWLSDEQITRAGRLRWWQLTSAGAARQAQNTPDHVLLTCARGVHSIPMAEHVLAMMLALSRGLVEDVQAAPGKQWKHPATRIELLGATCLILGLGDVGREVAQRTRAMGMRVLAVKRHVDPGQTVEHVDELADAAGLDRLLPQADHIVVTLPGVPGTQHTLSAERIARLRKGAYIYNVGRGMTIDEMALIEALRSGRLAGAGLDVFETEPLPPDSPLWMLPNVILSPHASAGTPRTGERLAAMFIEQLKRYVAGEPVENVVDRKLRY